MALSWNEIKDRALRFSREWADASIEVADAKPFLDAFFNVFGITRKKIGTFEYRVKKLSAADGYIDLLWKSAILVEMKSRGKNLDKAFEQAKEYTFGLKQHELPKYILVSKFRDRNRPETFIVVPRVSSENRPYIPFGFFDKNSIVSDTCMSILNGNLFHFGVLVSKMHMAWVQSICGRLKSDFRYSKDIVYNNFPWVENPTEKQIMAVETAAQKVLDIRGQYSNRSLAELYDPRFMPPELTKAHNELDRAVDLAYRPQPFTSEANRMELLFSLYEKYTADLFTKVKPKKTPKTKTKI